MDVFLKFRYGERDIANALRLRMAGALGGRVETLLAAIVCVIGAVASYELLSRGALRTFALVVVAPAAFVALLLVAALVVLPKVVLRRSARLRAAMTVDASEEGITVTAGDSYETIRWADCSRVDTDKRMCALYHGSSVLLVPRRAFRSAKQERAFFDLVGRLARRGVESAEAPEAPHA